MQNKIIMTERKIKNRIEKLLIYIRLTTSNAEFINEKIKAINEFDNLYEKKKLENKYYSYEEELKEYNNELEILRRTIPNNPYFVFHNLNPNGRKIGDCSIRALSYILNLDYKVVKKEISELLNSLLKKEKKMNRIWIKWAKSKLVDKTPPDEYTEIMNEIHRLGIYCGVNRTKINNRSIIIEYCRIKNLTVNYPSEELTINQFIDRLILNEDNRTYLIMANNHITTIDNFKIKDIFDCGGLIVKYVINM